MRRLLRVCVVALALVGLPLAASAQPALADDDRSGLISAGALVGAKMDTPDNWLMFGVDTRVKVAHGLEFEPRFTYQPLGGGHTIQLDANVLKNLDLARPGRFHPFFGIGGTLQQVSPDRGNGDSTLGLNLIGGTRIALSGSSGYEPFIVGQYSLLRDQFNPFSIVVGASFRLRGH